MQPIYHCNKLLLPKPTLWCFKLGWQKVDHVMSLISSAGTFSPGRILHVALVYSTNLTLWDGSFLASTGSAAVCNLPHNGA